LAVDFLSKLGAMPVFIQVL